MYRTTLRNIIFQFKKYVPLHLFDTKGLHVTYRCIHTGRKKRSVLRVSSQQMQQLSESTVEICMFRRCVLRLASQQTQKIVPCGPRFIYGFEHRYAACRLQLVK